MPYTSTISRTVATVTNWQGETRYVLAENDAPSIYATERDDPDDVIDIDLFPFYGPGGYSMIYLTDGDMLCARCARELYRSDPEEGSQLIPECAINFEPSSTGETCGYCGEYIPGLEPYCMECGTPESDYYDPPRSYTTFTRISGDEQICSHCLAKKVVKGDAHKIGKRRYQITDRYHSGEFTQEGA